MHTLQKVLFFIRKNISIKRGQINIENGCKKNLNAQPIDGFPIHPPLISWRWVRQPRPYQGIQRRHLLNNTIQFNKKEKKVAEYRIFPNASWNYKKTLCFILCDFGQNSRLYGKKSVLSQLFYLKLMLRVELNGKRYRLLHRYKSSNKPA